MWIQYEGDECPYKPGDKVMVLSGRDAETYAGSWYGDGMDCYVGRIFTVSSVLVSDDSYSRSDGLTALTFVEDDGEYMFDSRYVVPALSDRPDCVEIEGFLDEF